MTTSFGFLGLGMFGAPVAIRLLRQDFGLVVHDEWIEPVRYFLLKNSADLGENPRMLSALCDVVFAVLPDAAALRRAALGPLGLAEGLRNRRAEDRSCILVDLGTTSAEEARRLAADLAPAGIRYVEAPARGTPDDALQGRLVIPVGGADEDVAAVIPMLQALSVKCAHTGEIGSAHLISMLVEHVRATTAMAVAEAGAIARAAGLAPDALALWCQEERLLAPASKSLLAARPARTGHVIDTTTHNLALLERLLDGAGLDPGMARRMIELWRAAEKMLGPQADLAEAGRWLDTAIRPAPQAHDDRGHDDRGHDRNEAGHV